VIIRSVERARFALPLARALDTGGGTHRAREGFVLRVRDGDGRVGLGEATPLPSQGTESMDECDAQLGASGRALIGQTFEGAADLEALLDGVRDRPASRCGLETALLDLLGQARGRPVAELLSRALPGAVPVNALLTSAEPDEVRARVAEGFRTLKLKVGVGALADDVARVAAVHRAAGPDIALRLDANGAWSLEQARAALTALAEVAPIALCEQPVAGLDDLAALANGASIPLAADELLAQPDVAQAVIARRAAAALILKPMVLGGALPALALANLARAAGIGAIATTALDGSIARATAWHLAFALPGPTPACGLATGALLKSDLGPDAMAIVGGRAPRPTAPGLGARITAPLDWRSA